MTVFFHAIIRRHLPGQRSDTMDTITIYRDAHQDDHVDGIAEPVARLRIAPGQDPSEVMQLHGWDTCGEPTQRGGMTVVPVQPSEWSTPIAAS